MFRYFSYLSEKLHNPLFPSLNQTFLRIDRLPLGELMTAATGPSVRLLQISESRSVMRASYGRHSEPTTYTPYGYNAIEQPAGGSVFFNGEFRDLLTGLYFLGNGVRTFSPNIMRFLSADSWSPFESGGLNSYAYCMGDPINFGDPSGHVREAHRPPPTTRHLRTTISPVSQQSNASPTATPQTTFLVNPANNRASNSTQNVMTNKPVAKVEPNLRQPATPTPDRIFPEIKSLGYDLLNSRKAGHHQQRSTSHPEYLDIRNRLHNRLIQVSPDQLQASLRDTTPSLKKNLIEIHQSLRRK